MIRIDSLRFSTIKVKAGWSLSLSVLLKST